MAAFEARLDARVGRCFLEELHFEALLPVTMSGQEMVFLGRDFGWFQQHALGGIRWKQIRWKQSGGAGSCTWRRVVPCSYTVMYPPPEHGYSTGGGGRSSSVTSDVDDEYADIMKSSDEAARNI